MGKRNTVAKVIERIDARYEVQEVEFGKVYKWCPERVVIECGCGGRLCLNASMTSCEECSADHNVAVREELSELRHNDQRHFSKARLFGGNRHPVIYYHRQTPRY
jgi:hypothetical protein